MNSDKGHDLGTVIGLTPKDISTALALFYVSYVIFDFPSNLIMSKLSPRVWMARIVFATGVVGSCFAAVQSPWSLKFLRFLLGLVIAGMWPGMAFYLTLFYPPSRTAKRIGMYFTASQVSAAVVGLVSAGFQLMDGDGGLVGFRWMFLLYGLVAIVLSFVLLWWLPDRPLAPGQERKRTGLFKWLPASPEVLTGEDAIVHYSELKRVYHARPWGLRDLGLVLLDWRLWPLCLMYFGVVGVGIGTQLYGSVIIAAIQPEASDIVVSLLFAPIWIVSLPRVSPLYSYLLILTGHTVDGSNCYSPGDTYFRSLSPPKAIFLFCSRLHPDCRPTDNHLCCSKRLGPLRRPSDGGLWPGADCPNLHDMDLGNLSAPTWRSWRGSCNSSGIWSRKFGQCHHHIRPVFRMGRGF